MKSSLSPMWMPELLIALTFAWTSAGLAQNNTNLPQSPARNGTETHPAATEASTAAADTQREPSLTVAPGKDSPVTFPFTLSPAGVPFKPAALDSDGLPANSHFSYWTTEVIKLARAGIDDDVLLPFIDSVGMFNLSADEIIFLTDIGVSRQAMTAMMQHDFEVASGLRVPTASASPSSMLFPFGLGNETATPGDKSPVNQPSSPSTAAPAGPGNEATAATTAAATPSAGDAVIAHGGDITSDLAAFDSGATDQAPPAATPTPIKSRPAAARSSPLYAVRQPYAEAVTPPVIIVPGEDRSPNVVLIRFNP
jgi:hypothetical protein